MPFYPRIVYMSNLLTASLPPFKPLKGHPVFTKKPRSTCRIFSSPSSLANTHAANQPAKASPLRATKATKYNMEGNGCVALGGFPEKASLDKDTNKSKHKYQYSDSRNSKKLCSSTFVKRVYVRKLNYMQTVPENFPMGCLECSPSTGTPK